MWRYNVVGDTRCGSFDEREEALATAKEYISPENHPDDYDWTVNVVDED